VTAFTTLHNEPFNPRRFSGSVDVLVEIAAEDRLVLRDAPRGDQWWRKMLWTDRPQVVDRRLDVDRLWWRGGLC
jgi:hypothetical protein